ncbi:MAG: nodulation protein NfeD [Candidatus Zixiibacteriota bacterium]|nr:MAG: nodulation protein NfeD [candidate division Zixibacteria bacterium]
MMSKNVFIVLIAMMLMLSPAIRTDTLGNDTSEAAETEEVFPAERPSEIYVMTIDGAIGTVTADRVIDAVAQAEQERADVLLILMDTPGGFNDSFWAITKALMNSSVPSVVYVYPVGARATSAGVYIAYSAHIVAMAPSTHIGAAHVVSGSGQPMDSVLTEKIMNDAVAALRGMAERHGRNAEYAEKMARESISLTCSEALENNVINLIAEDIDELLEEIDGLEVNTALGRRKVRTKNPVQTPIEKTFIQSLLEIISSPNVAFILFSLGGLGLVLELYNPGAILPGVVGGICLILAFYSFRTLPINYAGLLLIIFAIILFILEVKVVSHGLLTIGGVVSIIIGGMMLIDTADPDLRVSRSVVIIVAVFLGALVLLAFTLAFKARITKPTTGREGLIGETGMVKERIDTSGYVLVAGELWEAYADEPIEVGEQVMVTEVDNMRIRVKRKS